MAHPIPTKPDLPISRHNTVSVLAAGIVFLFAFDQLVRVGFALGMTLFFSGSVLYLFATLAELYHDMRLERFEDRMSALGRDADPDAVMAIVNSFYADTRVDMAISIMLYGLPIGIVGMVAGALVAFA